ncbi:hypothetical protein ACEPPN_003182 [Leptodophora sp. 'Broadleaf-Isolate-01']
MQFSTTLILAAVAALASAQNPFTFTSLTSITAGTPFNITWAPSTGTTDTVSLVLRQGESTALDTIETIASHTIIWLWLALGPEMLQARPFKAAGEKQGTDDSPSIQPIPHNTIQNHQTKPKANTPSLSLAKIQNTGSYLWTPPTTLVNGAGYAFQIIDDGNTDIVNYSNQFSISSTNTVTPVRSSTASSASASASGSTSASASSGATTTTSGSSAASTSGSSSGNATTSGSSRTSTGTATTASAASGTQSATSSPTGNLNGAGSLKVGGGMLAVLGAVMALL